MHVAILQEHRRNTPPNQKNRRITPNTSPNPKPTASDLPSSNIAQACVQAAATASWMLLLLLDADC
jgi:hypothetical protein